MKQKYNNKKTNGYDSKRESNRADVLKLLERAGEISSLQEQVKYEIIPSYYKVVDGKRKCISRATHYYADFQYVENGETVVEDCKGCRTEVYNIKKKLMLHVHGIEVKES